jgi:uncharacterized protein (TIGR03067 family)
MKRLALIPGTVLIVAGLVVPSAPGFRGEADSIEGTWELVSSVYDGKDSIVKEKQIWKISKTHVTYSFGTQDAYQVDTKAKPKTIAVTQIRPDDKAADGKKLVGIYEIKGDSLKICVAAADKGLPKEFKSTPGSGHNLLTLKRVPPEPAKLDRK